ncbi:MAG: hypothetical protein JNK85_12220 [Verrucomicrobiales bacterium]|nr:hypothetical protein [Verrucomicrobiales bacterium]
MNENPFQDAASTGTQSAAQDPQLASQLRPCRPELPSAKPSFVGRAPEIAP